MVKVNALYEIEMKNQMEGFLTDHKIECLMIIFPLKRDYDKDEIYNELVYDVILHLHK
jgi:hypothetical protein